MIRLDVRLRKDFRNRKCAAPFINGQNIWDIPIKQWTPDVRLAVLVAYKVGVDHAIRHFLKSNIASELTDGSIDWPTLSGENE